ncbi:unnamed protein product [Cuscuta europaea]|uniref:Uncharacterized protein n=1 Tax=Cuscuta europaea TaxID=41803 RepID=A0A9P0Z4B5_CUSEU|nr:unnamed protein product [Cuscuta europaea]
MWLPQSAAILTLLLQPQVQPILKPIRLVNLSL